MNRLVKYLLWLLPYQRSTLYIPLDRAEVLKLLNSAAIDSAEAEKTSFWSTRTRYEIEVYSGSFAITGPIGNKQWTLSTQGEIRSATNGTVLELKMRLKNTVVWQAVLVLGFYCAAVIFWVWRDVDLAFTLPILTGQMLFMYAIILGVFQYNAARILELLRQTLNS